MVALNMGHKEIADLLTNHGANHDQQDEARWHILFHTQLDIYTGTYLLRTLN